ncbi:MAG TPA: hypothetical protein VGB24_06010 [Longimicrobium sp.]|jgi:hypothetical protein|uniref:hypothetical protein n=1 Tax=Longimicrobium sp. TaxID=2029185 RepID=UPI002ED976FA
MPRYERRRLSRGEEMKAVGMAAGVAAGIGAAAWYVARIFLARERVDGASAPSPAPLPEAGG